MARRILLVHGVWHGSWCWEALVPQLRARGWAPETIDLPSASGDPELGMLADAAAIRERLSQPGDPVTVLAHSYAGIPVGEGAAGLPGVRQLIYLAAHLLKAGETDKDVAGIDLPDDAYFMVPPPEDAVATMYHDVPADVAAAAVSRLRPHSSRVVVDRTTEAAWQQIPTAAIICDDDRIHAEVYTERLGTWLTSVRHLPGSHSPFLSRPGDLAAMIDEIASKQ
ncbi:alpha/beta hydrolase [Actinoplanes sp. NPDC049596]|uniref:alpha/beta hydrolase n=1 Tax=unclassified Actinoplanes TaxID=2626549 RepID=UPI00342F22A8